MKKDAYYFPHFSNARNDSKLIKLRRVLGIEGYGIYFMLLEVLRDQTDYKFPISGVEDLAYEWHTSKEKIFSVINDFFLFDIIDNVFFSKKFVFYLQPYIEKSNRAREAANIRWNNANADANVLQMQSKSNASKVKESKVKESKVKENNIDIRLRNFKKEVNSIIEENKENFWTNNDYDNTKKFINYWTEKNRSNTKLKFELESTFETSKRMATWKKRGEEMTFIKPVIQTTEKYKPPEPDIFWYKVKNSGGQFQAEINQLDKIKKEHKDNSEFEIIRYQ